MADFTETAAEAVDPGRIVRLEAQDGTVCELPANAAALSGLVRNMLDPEDADDDSEDEDASIIPLPNVSSAALEQVAAFCRHHVEDVMDPIERPIKNTDIRQCTKEWYADFTETLWEDPGLFFEVMMAANYMEVVPLLDLTCCYFTGRIKRLSPEEIEETYGVQMTETEKRQVREEYEATKRHEKWGENGAPNGAPADKA